MLAGEGAGWQADLLLSLSRMRRNFTKTPSILQMSHPLTEKSGLTSFASRLGQAAVSTLPSSALESEPLSNFLSTPWSNKPGRTSHCQGFPSLRISVT